MEHFVKVISAQGMWGGVLATLTFVVIGFLVTRMGLFTKETNQKLSQFTLKWALPFLCIVAFMQPANAQLGKEIGIVVGISIVFYVLAAVISELIVKFGPKMMPRAIQRKALEMYEASDKSQSSEHFKAAAVAKYEARLLTIVLMLSYGSLQFFAYPMVIAMSGSIFDGSALALAQVWCIPYMIGAFSYVMLKYSGTKVSTKNIKPVIKAVFSPMMCCLYFSLIMWAIQFAVPHKYAIVDGKPYQISDGGKQFWAGFKTNLPAIGKVLDSGVGIISPLAWLVIGGTLANSNIKKAAKSATVWTTTALKLILMPLIMLFIGMALVAGGLITTSTGTLLVLLGATPPAAVCIIFSVANNHPETSLTAEVSALSTLLCLIAMPVWVIIGYVAMKEVAPQTHAAASMLSVALA
ncbi:AEC family transporter [[Mycoplasma] gypis]|uniref:AEC family transporter n=1 Tax=[Mycoplasma] gypis TaxID=92404 RepID=A0ABZ2RP75_9BACT|nr:AEC family transporter [[Mycoplasma] gypis]MBN0919028.1 AEC family transporter [[Mycoplasma] gypis]